MNIKELANKPKLIEINLDDPTIVEKYGEAITFHTYDTVSLSTYFDFYDARSDNQFGNLEKIMRKMILSDTGKTIIEDDEDLPIDIATAAIQKIGDVLGKSQRKSSTETVGQQPE